MALTASGFWYPDEGTAFNINTIMSTAMSSVESKVGPHIVDTGWVDVTIKSGYTGNVQVRRIGKLVYFKGAFNKSSAMAAGLHAVGTVPAGFRPLSYLDSSAPLWPNPSAGGSVFGTVVPNGAIELRIPGNIGSITTVTAKGLSGYTID